jgi:hypothetical protein
MQLYSVVPAWNEDLYAQPVPFLVLLTQPCSDGADYVISRLKLPSANSIFQGSKEVKI